MIVVSDNGPIGFLVQIDRIELLPLFYKRVLVPMAVHEELLSEGTPASIREWLSNPPGWFEVRAPAGSLQFDLSGRGEREAILLAKELRAPLLCDDRQGVSRAKREGLNVTGTLGILQVAHAAQATDIEDAIRDLASRTDFHLPEALLPGIVAQAHAMRDSYFQAQGQVREEDALSLDNDQDIER